MATKPPDKTEDDDLQARLTEASAALIRIRRGESPTAEELSAAPLLEFWAFTAADGILALTGVVTDHPTLPRGARIITSPLLWVAPDLRSARTLSRFYRLGVRLDDELSQGS